MIEIEGVSQICRHEVLRIPHNKYGLSLVNEAKFLRQGFIIDGRYYLYNIFFDTTIGAATDDIPYTIKIINEEIPARKLFLRCDEKVALPADRMISTVTTDFQKYRGITVDFGDIERLVNKKEIIVHYNPDHLDKVVMIIKPDRDREGHSFYHIEVEELWNPDKARDSFVITNYVHSQYYPDKKVFNHVWCVESDAIEISTWSKLVCATLDEPFRDLFIEMFSMKID